MEHKAKGKGRIPLGRLVDISTVMWCPSLGPCWLTIQNKYM